MTKLVNKENLIKALPYLIVLLVALAGIAVYLTFFGQMRCESFECFQRGMSSCKKVVYLNDVSDATWEYKIIGRQGNECRIEVELKQAKQGSLNLDKLTGYSMECEYPVGISDYPDKDLSKCHGRLKEELQNIIIQRLHIYIVDNLGKFDQSLNKI